MRYLSGSSVDAKRAIVRGSKKDLTERERGSTLKIIIPCLMAVTKCQVVDSQNAAILRDMRYLQGDGTFGAAYSQEDGVEFKEESDEYGNRRGSYSYVDPTGQRRTVHYTAGVNGFRASGDHIPAQPPPTPPKPEYVPLPQYNPPDYKLPLTPSKPPRYQLIHQPYKYQYETQEPSYEPQPQPTTPPSFHAVPIHVTARVPPAPRPRKPSPPPPRSEIKRNGQKMPTLKIKLQYQATYPEYPVRYEPGYEQPAPLGPVVPQYHREILPAQPRPTSPSYYYNELTTPPSRRFYPPGKLDFNRTPDGFSYTFSKS
ncbi:uncharacterized protein LOC131663078 [Phymastichus coffea]|uniref:uncharacterized protein LOC131663078 n=1 Tax=Phymastichus coffea TaxID=108790 RepID=UPI00273A98E0|nr:uncharacterized protein LOC131663078 [Phymastichus coffea]